MEIREHRLSSILSYRGTAADLFEKSSRCALECRENSFTQCGDCSAQRAMLPLSQVRDSVVVNHAPIGCAADFSLFNAQFRRGLIYRGLQPVNLGAISTNLSELDIVYGGGEKLESTLREAYRRFSPKAIFVTTSCASGIIGDDIEEIATQMEEELGIPIIPIFCEGFRSKIWTTGFDACYHGVLRKLVKPPREKQEDVINIFHFTNELTFTPLLAKLGLRPRYLIQHATVEELSQISDAAATANMCETLCTYIAKGLEQEYGVPEVKSPPPYGLEWTDQWIREVARITHREELAEQVIKSERERIAFELVQIRNELAGKRVFVIAGASFGHSMLAIAKDLGLSVCGIVGFHHDQRFDTEDEKVNSLLNCILLYGDIKNYNVCNKQPYQVVNLFRKANPDLLMARHDTMPGTAVKLGIPVFFSSDANLQIGYDGLIYTGRQILRVLRTKKFVENIATHVRLPYTDWWAKQNPFAFGGVTNVE